MSWPHVLLSFLCTMGSLAQITLRCCFVFVSFFFVWWSVRSTVQKLYSNKLTEQPFNIWGRKMKLTPACLRFLPSSLITEQTETYFSFICRGRRLKRLDTWLLGTTLKSRYQSNGRVHYSNTECKQVKQWLHVWFAPDLMQHWLSSTVLCSKLITLGVVATMPSNTQLSQ